MPANSSAVFRVSVVARLVALMATAVPAAALVAQVTPPAPKVFNDFFRDARSVTIDLKTGFVSKVLPFDEPFLVRVSPLEPARLTDVSLHFESTKTFAEPPGDCSKEGAKWVSSRQWRLVPAGTGGEASGLVVVPPLRSARYYRVCLLVARSPDANQARAYRDGLAGALDRELREFSDSTPGGLDTAGIRRAQRAMMRAALSMPEVTSVRVRKGSIIDTTASIAEKGWKDQRKYLSRLRILDKRVQQRSNDIVNARLDLDAIRDKEFVLAGVIGAKVVSQASSMGILFVPKRLTARSEMWSSADLAPFMAPVQDTLVALQGVIGALTLPADSAQLRLATAIVNQLRVELASMEILDQHLVARTEAIRELVVMLQQDAPVERDVEVLSASSVADLTSRTRQRVSVDLGIATLWRSGHAAPYVGASFYFTAVNQDVPLSLQPGALWGLMKRPSLAIAVTTSSIAGADRTDLLASNSLLIDFGIRPWDAFRISSGCMLYRKVTNQLTGNTKLACAPSVSVGIDDAVKDALNGFISLLPFPRR